MDSSGERQFSEREVALILKTASELQDTGDAPGRGLTLRELEHFAAEAGMDPALIRRAAASVDTVTPTASHRLLGAPMEIVVERTFAGEIDQAAHERLLAHVRQATGELGEMQSVDRLFGWKGRVDGVKTEVSVSPADGPTRVRVRMEMDEAALGAHMGRRAGRARRRRHRRHPDGDRPRPGRRGRCVGGGGRGEPARRPRALRSLGASRAREGECGGGADRVDTLMLRRETLERRRNRSPRPCLLSLVAISRASWGRRSSR
jgi:hypothetical protein